MSSNPDLTLDLLALRRQGRVSFLFAGQVNSELPFMRNDEVAPTGRPAGAQGWAGLPNLYYWIDRENGIGGFWATQIFPFADPSSIGGYFDLETAVYEQALVPASA